MTLELIERLAEEAMRRNLGFLLIGGHAVGILGHPRLTLDIDLLVLAARKSDWEKLLGQYGYRCFSEGKAFAQFEGQTGWPRIDLMLVDDVTFSKLRSAAVQAKGSPTPSPQHMVALKLHAANSATRDPDKAQQDWLDIQKIILLHHLDPREPAFASLICRYGGEEGLERIRRMCQT